jgi:membrane associated rhomboid family serine protease
LKIRPIRQVGCLSPALPPPEGKDVAAHTPILVNWSPGLRKHYHDPERGYVVFPIRDNVPRRQTPLVTWAIIALNVAVFLVEVSLPKHTLMWVFYHFGLVPARYANHSFSAWLGPAADSIWPFFTNMFLHGGLFHLVSNMWALWIFGGAVEDRLGHGRYLALYLLSGIGASLTHFVTNLHSTVPAIGASGAISGVMGAYFLMFPLAQVITLVPVFFLPVFLPIPAVFYIGVWFLTQFFSGIAALVAPQFGGGIAWWAHVGGFLAGVVLTLVLRPKQRSYYPDEVLLHYAR